MLTDQRKRHLLSVLRRDGRIVAKTLSTELGLSEDSIRRDLRELAAEGLLKRVHGGALPLAPAEADISHREGLVPTEKAAVGRAAAMLVLPGQVVFVDGGTTAIQLARHLPLTLRATVVTHSPSVAVQLVHHLDVEVVMLGGRIFKHSMVALGATTLSAIEGIRADTYFMGVTGVQVDAGLTTGDMEEAQIKRALMDAASETVVLASSEKLGAASAWQIHPLVRAGRIVVPAGVASNRLSALRKAGAAIVRAG